jgi:hypothetical protein
MTFISNILRDASIGDSCLVSGVMRVVAWPWRPEPRWIALERDGQLREAAFLDFAQLSNTPLMEAQAAFVGLY